MTNMIDVTNSLVKEAPGGFAGRVCYARKVAGIAERIRKILELREISASELSRRAGLSRTHVSTTLASLDANPEASLETTTLKAIARAGEVSWEWLVTGHATFGELPTWPLLRERAKAISPGVTDGILDEVAKCVSPLGDRITASMVVDIAALVARHAPPSQMLPDRHKLKG